MRFLKTLALLLLLAPAARADDSLALANQLLVNQNVQSSIKNSFESGFRSSLERLRAAGAPDELIVTIQSQVDQYFTDNFNWATLQPQLALVYTKAFTQQELAAIVAFQNSPAGKKFAATMPSVLKDSSVLIQAQLSPNMPAFQQKLMATIKDYQSAHAAPSSSGLLNAPSPGSSTLLNSGPAVAPSSPSTAPITVKPISP